MYSLLSVNATVIIALRVISLFLSLQIMEPDLHSIRTFLSSYDRRTIQDIKLRRAAVLLLLYPKDERLHLLFTKRTSTVEHHKGQVSLPGGSADADDESLIHTALRETCEEIGLRSPQVEILGIYDDQWTPTGFCITPVVAFVQSLPALTINQHEVEEIIEIPVSFFLDPANERVQLLERSGKQVHLYFYQFGKHEVWGATAAIVRSFLAGVVRNGASNPLGSRSEGKNPLEIT